MTRRVYFVLPTACIIYAARSSEKIGNKRVSPRPERFYRLAVRKHATTSWCGPGLCRLSKRELLYFGTPKTYNWISVPCFATNGKSTATCRHMLETCYHVLDVSVLTEHVSDRKNVDRFGAYRKRVILFRYLPKIATIFQYVLKA